MKIGPRHQRKRGESRGGDRGFTLVEMVIALVATSVIVVSVAPYFRVNLKSYMTVRLAKDSLEAARIGFNRMTSEMRRLQDPNDIDYADSDDFQFWYMNPDGSYTQVEYYYHSSTGQVRRWTGGFNSRLVEGVSTFNITYYDKSGSSFSPGSSTYPNIWRVRIKMILGSDDETYTLYQDVFFKGLGKYY
jgi:prepilin-type N-terminal cleavage/methylation domain-containing protein